MRKLFNIKKNLGDKIINVFNTHTGGEPTRILFGDQLSLKGKTIGEKRDSFKKKYDWIRKILMREPRGHKNMFGAIILKSKKKDFAIFFMDNEGYLDMCGHAIIGISVLLNQIGKLKDKKNIYYETPAGKIGVRLHKNKNKITIINFISYLLFANFNINTSKGKIKGDLCYSGNYVFIVKSNKKLLIKTLISYGLEIKEKINNLRLYDSIKKRYFKISLVEFFHQEKPQVYSNFVVFGSGQLDRSPCGTGSCSKLAQLYSHNKLKVGKRILVKSPIGSLFSAKIIEVKKIAKTDLLSSEITGSAFITSIQKMYLEKKDIFQKGFII